jgi:16S rRNA pseudouridine516 synthase
MKLVKLLANLGYGSRRDVAAMFREGRINDAEDGEVLYADDGRARAFPGRRRTAGPPAGLR